MKNRDLRKHSRQRFTLEAGFLWLSLMLEAFIWDSVS